MARRATMARLALAVLTAAYFIYFVRDSVGVRFNPDEMMNMGFHFRLSPARMALAQLEIWRDFYRPMGGLFYMPLYHWFGLNPAPYHAAAALILAGAVWAMYRLARFLEAPRAAAWLMALVACYHAGISNLYYNTAFIYDALCGLFYFGAFEAYVRLRRGRLPIFLALFLCALNSKEMAVTLPPLLLAYEWIYRRRPRLNLPIVVSSAMTLLYLSGRFFGAHALGNQDGYRPVFSLARIENFQRDTLRDLLFLGDLTPARIAAVWLLITYLAFRRDNRLLRFCWAWMLITVVPIEFLPNRGGACLFIPLLGFGLFAAVVFLDVARSAAGFLSREPVFRWAGERALGCAVVAAACCGWADYNRDLKESFVRPAMAEAGAQTWDVIRQIQTLELKASPNATVAFLSDPFSGYDMFFIAELWFRDPTVTIWLESHERHTPEELARAEHLYDFQEGKLRLVR